MIDIMRYFCAETFICAVSTVKSKKRKKRMIQCFHYLHLSAFRTKIHMPLGSFALQSNGCKCCIHRKLSIFHPHDGRSNEPM